MINGLKETDPELHRKNVEIFRNQISMTMSSFRGELGQQFDKQFTEMTHGIHPFVLSCAHHDGLLWLAWTLDLALKRGFDYEESDVLNNTLRGAKLTGCTGLLVFDKTSNDRGFSGYDISQYRLDTETQMLAETRVMTFFPQSINRF
jgi:hypothetical protein